MEADELGSPLAQCLDSLDQNLLLIVAEGDTGAVPELARNRATADTAFTTKGNLRFSSKHTFILAHMPLCMNRFLASDI